MGVPDRGPAEGLRQLPHVHTGDAYQNIMLLQGFPASYLISLFSEKECLRPGFKVLNTYANTFFFTVQGAFETL